MGVKEAGVWGERERGGGGEEEEEIDDMEKEEYSDEEDDADSEEEEERKEEEEKERGADTLLHGTRRVGHSVHIELGPQSNVETRLELLRHEPLELGELQLAILTAL